MIKFFAILCISAGITFGVLAGFITVMRSNASEIPAPGEKIEDGATAKLLEVSPNNFDQDLENTEFRNIDEEIEEIGKILSHE